jgi:hypothetical protein
MQNHFQNTKPHTSHAAKEGTRDWRRHMATFTLFMHSQSKSAEFSFFNSLLPGTLFFHFLFLYSLLQELSNSSLICISLFLHIFWVFLSFYSTFWRFLVFVFRHFLPVSPLTYFHFSKDIFNIQELLFPAGFWFCFINKKFPRVFINIDYTFLSSPLFLNYITSLLIGFYVCVKYFISSSAWWSLVILLH